MRSAERIRALNDRFRTTGEGGRVVITQGVAALGTAAVRRAVEAMRTFDAFTPENDPYGEHDFGSFEAEGKKFFWKIDLYEEPSVKAAGGLPATTPPAQASRLTRGRPKSSIRLRGRGYPGNPGPQA